MTNDQNILADLAVAVDMFNGGSDSQCGGCPKVLARGSVFARNMSFRRRSWPCTGSRQIYSCLINWTVLIT
jgi:hypothetical protein